MTTRTSPSQQIVAELLRYYHSTRGVGHTDLLELGTGQHDVEKRPYLRFNINHCDPINVKHRLRGNRLPLALDNGFVIRLLEGVSEQLGKDNHVTTNLESVLELNLLRIKGLRKQVEVEHTKVLDYANRLGASEHEVWELRGQILNWKRAFITIGLVTIVTLVTLAKAVGVINS